MDWTGFLHVLPIVEPRDVLKTRNAQACASAFNISIVMIILYFHTNLFTLLRQWTQCTSIKDKSSMATEGRRCRRNHNHSRHLKSCLKKA